MGYAARPDVPRNGSTSNVCSGPSPAPGLLAAFVCFKGGTNPTFPVIMRCPLPSFHGHYQPSPLLPGSEGPPPAQSATGVAPHYAPPSAGKGRQDPGTLHPGTQLLPLGPVPPNSGKTISPPSASWEPESIPRGSSLSPWLLSDRMMVFADRRGVFPAHFWSPRTSVSAFAPEDLMQLN